MDVYAPVWVVQANDTNKLCYIIKLYPPWLVNSLDHLDHPMIPIG